MAKSAKFKAVAPIRVFWCRGLDARGGEWAVSAKASEEGARLMCPSIMHKARKNTIKTSRAANGNLFVVISRLTCLSIWRKEKWTSYHYVALLHEPNWVSLLIKLLNYVQLQRHRIFNSNCSRGRNYSERRLSNTVTYFLPMLHKLNAILLLIVMTQRLMYNHEREQKRPNFSFVPFSFLVSISSLVLRPANHCLSSTLVKLCSGRHNNVQRPQINI